MLSFLLCFSPLLPAHATGPHRRRSDRATQQERVRVSNVQCLVRSDRILATAEQGSAARYLAAWRQDQHHLRRGNLGGIRCSSIKAGKKAVPWDVRDIHVYGVKIVLDVLTCTIFFTVCKPKVFSCCFVNKMY